MIISGCTNTLATNYNPSANFNDGSCVFLSGCTKEYADNYNPDAVIDDGSCYCGEFNVVFNLEESQTQILPTSGETCQYIFDFSVMVDLDCYSVLDFYATQNNKTLTEILNEIQLGLKVIDESGNTITNTTLYEHSVVESPFGFYGSGFCETLYDIIAEENNIECTNKLLIKRKWLKYSVLLGDVENHKIDIMLNIKGMPFNNCIYLDDFELNKICTKTVTTCSIIPMSYGFELEKKINNNKTTTDNTNIINSKETTIRINPYQMIEKDLIDFFNSKKFFLGNDKFRNLTIEKIYNLKDKKTLKCIYEFYLNHCASKSLDYNYTMKVFSKINPLWYDVINQFIPAGSIYKNGKYYYKNLIFDRQEHHYLNIKCYDDYVEEKICDNICNQ